MFVCRHLQLVMLTFRADFVQPDDQPRAQAFEMAAYKYLRSQFASDHIEALALGNEIVDYVR